MTAVRPARLRAQIEDLVAVFADHDRLRRRCLDLLGLYASRVRSAGEGVASGALRSAGVPQPVLNEMERALVTAGADDPAAAAMAAEALWAAPLFEARWLAVGLLHSRPTEEIPAWAAAWCETADDPRLLARLASGPLGRLAVVDRQRFWSTIHAYLESSSRRATALAWMALRAAIPDLAGGDLPQVFRALSASPAADSGEEWRAEVDVVAAAARRSPPEAARFLVDELAAGRPGAERLVRQVLPAFPEKEQTILRRRLRSSRFA